MLMDRELGCASTYARYVDDLVVFDGQLDLAVLDIVFAFARQIVIHIASKRKLGVGDAPQRGYGGACV